MNLVNGHVAMLALRRLRAGEWPPAEVTAIEAHAAACSACRAKLRSIDDEQRRFAQQISFDRFAAGVERAAREQAGQGARPATRLRARLLAFPLFALAAAVALVVIFPPRGTHDPNRIKGGAGMTVRIAGAAGQRNASVDATEPLASGERLRIGYQAGEHRYLLALSLDERGEVTPLYPEAGRSIELPPHGAPAATRYLPDSHELTGAGLEKIVVVLSDQPIDVEAARRAARAAYERARGDLVHLPRLDLPGEQFTRTFSKP